MPSCNATVSHLRRVFDAGTTRSIVSRRENIASLQRLFEENKDQFCDAIYQDLKRSKIQSLFSEVNPIISDCGATIEKLKQWMRPEKAKLPLYFMLDSAVIVREPLGVVLIISPWNYPVVLLFQPLIAALAAGNCVVLKPSEISTSTAELVARLVPQYLPQDVVRVVTGGVQETTELLEEKFDHIFYTGSPAVGKIIMKAAANFLTPVTLELGGKCPVIVDDDCDLLVSARRIAWGKWLNCGQVCVAPDYVLCTAKTQKKLIENLKIAINEFYGTDASEAVDYPRIINQQHF